MIQMLWKSVCGLPGFALIAHRTVAAASAVSQQEGKVASGLSLKVLNCIVITIFGAFSFQPRLQWSSLAPLTL